FDGQIAHEIVGTNRHHPAAHSFDQHMLNPTLKSVKSSEDTLDIDVHLLGKAAHNRRCRRLQPDWINFVDRSPQQIGFIPAQLAPAARNRRNSWTAVCVLPRPVSVSVMKSSRDLLYAIR